MGRHDALGRHVHAADRCIGHAEAQPHRRRLHACATQAGPPPPVAGVVPRAQLTLLAYESEHPPHIRRMHVFARRAMSRALRMAESHEQAAPGARAEMQRRGKPALSHERGATGTVGQLAVVLWRGAGCALCDRAGGGTPGLARPRAAVC